MKTTKLITALLFISFLFSMCKKDSQNNSTTTNGAYYVKGTLNGQPWNWQVTINNSAYVVGSSGRFSNGEGDVTGGITALISAVSGYEPNFGVEFKTFHNVLYQNSVTNFNSFVTTGNWPYANTLDYVTDTKSIVISYIDKTGKLYNSIGAQTGSNINIISATPVSGDAYNIYAGLKIKLTLNCILYPTDGTGDSLKITNTEATIFLEDMLF